MKTYLIATFAAGALATGAYGHMTQNSHNPAIKGSTVRTTSMAAKGRNSFTEDQAQGRLAKAGYTSVSKLAKDRRGVWQGTAMKGSKSVHVALDYKGNVTVR